MKANFKIKKNDKQDTSVNDSQEHTELTEEEFEEYMSKMGAAGSFMVFRSNRKKDDELGIEEL
jgi:hypothetical protein|tara:strand:+ start:241 stop:429 length:189 start_codon:yes stop_codon:yes gene_type:complete